MKNFLLFSLSIFIFNSLSAQCSGSEPLISQVVEASSDKAIEFYNPSNVTIDLSTYTLKRHSNGGNGTTVNMIGMIAPGDVFVFAQNNDDVGGAFDAVNGGISHNGNDSYILSKNGTVIDSYGDSDSSVAFGEDSNMIRNLSGMCPYDTNTTDPFDATAYTITAYSSGIPNDLGVMIGVLPVSLNIFKGDILNKEINLNWQTAQELNNSHFEIQHSTDNRTYTTLGKETGAGNSDVKVDYNFTHDNPTNGINYYRLQQFDFDGQSEYSQVISVHFGKEAGISVYPNPVQSEVVVTLDEEFATNATAEVISQNGSSVLTQTFTAKSFTQSINVNNLPAGIYVLRITNGNEIYTERFVKK